MRPGLILKRGIATAALLLCACASSGESLTGPTAAITPPAAGQQVSQLPGGYQLSQPELDLDCKKLTGRMAVRIVQIRDYQTRRQASATSRTIQKTSTTLLGGSYEGTDPEGRNARDRAMLEAYNRRLIEKGCPSYDLNVELDPAAKDPPRLIQPKKS